MDLIEQNHARSQHRTITHITAVLTLRSHHDNSRALHIRIRRAQNDKKSQGLASRGFPSIKSGHSVILIQYHIQLIEDCLGGFYLEEEHTGRHKVDVELL
ncbi:hypothetical protein EYC84_002900 [Monilinia fructicola]|uniref:Uncharacterized protein n=1 Tax=Monilinia fructicola TaxID=38448 RepID=A0A5M9JRZ9_MONFR|nr:hypothetical protein EYC84_002900 [Monilinia fructicola]